MTKNKNSGRLHSTAHPVVYEVNTRVLLNELSAQKGTRVTLDTVPDSVIEEWTSFGFDAIWLMGVWTTGKTGIQMARGHPGLLEECKRTLPDFTPSDVIGSPYAVKSYAVSASLGGNKGLLALRKRLEKHGLGLILDFVPNHTARDHQWVMSHPEYYVAGGDGDEVTKRELFFKTTTSKGQKVLAYGRDPYYPGWTDTAQLNYFNPDTRKASMEKLKTVATLCDGVRCDMAMLILQDVFRKTWQGYVPETASGEFWREAIAVIRDEHPQFRFIGEVYWNLEWQLQQLGFDYTYDKTLYDRLLHEGASAVYDHLHAETNYQRKSVRFIENHDEQRSARVFASEGWLLAAATIVSTVPGMVLFHEGQLDARRIKLPVQLSRRPDEAPVHAVRNFYKRLLANIAHPVFREGEWKLLHARPAWGENQTWRNFLAFWWQSGSQTRFVVVNYAPQSGQCYIGLDFEELRGTTFEFRDLLSQASYSRDRHALESKGMYFDLPAYGIHLFDVKAH
jgi:hypothetical protein